MVPPVIDRWGPGLRVPFIIASPWSKKGYVDHNQYETVSMLSFIEGLFNLPPLSTRDANALPPVAAFPGQPDLYLEATQGQPVSYQIPAYNNPISYSWSGNADGLVLEPGHRHDHRHTGRHRQLTRSMSPSTVLHRRTSSGQQNKIRYVSGN